MIRVRVELDERGYLSSFEADGHSDIAEAGTNIVCSAFTGIARAAAKVLEAEPGVRLAGEAPAPGLLRFRISECESEKLFWLKGVQDVLVMGI